MLITVPQLPPKKGYVEVEVDGRRTYRNVETGILLDDESPTPTLDERVAELEDALAATDETAIELYEAMMAQEEVNTAQDDALIELYEMIGG